MAENNEGWEVWAERLPDVETKQELPEGVWEDYKKYQTLNNREGDWSAPEMKNPDALTKIRNLMSKVKDLPNTMSYYAHKVADPMYANVDYMGQQVGDWAAKKINNVARAFDISPEARQYGRFEEEEYDPEAVDVRFGRNAYKEGYDNLGDYLEAKDQEKVDRYRGYNHANRFAPIENADDKFYTLSDTQTLEDWQPETTSGKVAKGAIETAGNMLPENLKALMEEKGIEGGAKMLGTLSPVYAKAKEYIKAKKLGKEAEVEPLLVSDKGGLKIYEQAETTPNTAKYDYLGQQFGKDVSQKRGLKRMFKNAKKNLSTEEYNNLLKRVDTYNPEYQIDDALWDHELARGTAIQADPATVKSIARNARGGQPKPLPNPAAQRAEALARNNEPIENLITPKISKYMEENFSPEESQRLMKSFNRIRQDRDNAQSGYELFGRKDYLQKANELNDTLTEDGIMEMLGRVKRYDNNLLSRQDELIGFLKQPVQDKNLSDIGLLLQENVSDDILNRFRRLPDEWQAHFSQQIMRGIRSGELKTNGDVLDYFKKIATEPLDI